MPGELTDADLIADWLSPSQTVEIFDKTFGETHSHYRSREAILECLRGSQIKSITASSTFHLENGGQTESAFYAIPSEDWERIESNDSFWATGIIAYRRRIYGRAAMEMVRHFNVRFNKANVLTIVGPHKRQTGSENETTSAEAEPEQKGPRVAEAHLQSWYAFYKSVTPEAIDTEDYAWAHARRCFPDKTVSRERVRALRGSVRRGPKGKMV